MAVCHYFENRVLGGIWLVKADGNTNFIHRAVYLIVEKNLNAKLRWKQEGCSGRMERGRLYENIIVICMMAFQWLSFNNFGMLAEVLITFG